jgi:hypothetical protein
VASTASEMPPPKRTHVEDVEDTGGNTVTTAAAANLPKKVHLVLYALFPIVMVV